MMLWLPLQAVAGIGVPMWASPTQAESALDVEVSQAQVSAAHGHHASAGTDAMGSHQAGDDGSGPLHTDSTDPQCGDCTLACAAFAAHQIVSDTQRVLGEGPAPHGEEAFASAAGNQALEPPIAAA